MPCPGRAKKTVNTSIPAELLDAARAENINLSATLEAEIDGRLRERRRGNGSSATRMESPRITTISTNTALSVMRISGMKYRVVIALLLGASMTIMAENAPAQDWPTFGGNVQSTSANLAPTGITAANVARLRHRQVKLDGVVDASAIYLHGVTIRGARHDAIFVTTSYGKTLALDADSGDVLWEYTPPGYRDLAGTRQFTNSTPAADPDRQSIYAASPDGYVQKLSVGDGHRLWRTSITKLPQREKMDSPLKFFRGHVIAVTGGYIGDQPPYQGHVAILDGSSGRLLQVWNSLCSDRAGLMQPDSCPQTRSAIWGRAGAVIDPGDGHIFIATGNGDWNGKTDWGDALVELDASATKMLGNYAPANTEELNDDDLDLGSTSPVLLGGDWLAQGGKDGKIRLLSRKAIASATPHQDHELQIVSTPSGTDLFTQPAVWQHGGQTWLFAADNGGTAASELQNGRLQKKWGNGTSGTSPFEAGGLLFVYALEGGLNVYEAASGKHIATLACGPGHWNSPIVVDGEIILPEGNANDRATSGVLDIWSPSAGR
ncbi:MAG TPA: PQQ-binding-like beta-propeller repeat protein [Steroidobacteraceae bacterium]|jgi:hypothetical protein|nr:PQQ-binding-like beta-propeller repeat protein [Steroidobacteraceae bacterium]